MNMFSSRKCSMTNQEKIRRYEARKRKEARKIKNAFAKRLTTMITIIIAWPVSGIIGNLILLWIASDDTIVWSKAIMYGPFSLLTSLVHLVRKLSDIGFFYGLLTVICVILIIAIIAFVILKVYRWLFGLGPIFNDKS